eukprot:COSAG01_NODE_2389_length_7776_cov_8.174547_1_plen_132_part_00
MPSDVSLIGSLLPPIRRGVARSAQGLWNCREKSPQRRRGCRAHVGSCRRRSRGALCPRCRSGRVSSARVSRATRGMLIDLVRQPPTPHDELTSPCIFYQRVWRLRRRPRPTHVRVVGYGLCLPQRAVCCGV